MKFEESKRIPKIFRESSGYQIYKRTCLEKHKNIKLNLKKKRMTKMLKDINTLTEVPSGKKGFFYSI